MKCLCPSCGREVPLFDMGCEFFCAAELFRGIIATTDKQEPIWAIYEFWNPFNIYQVYPRSVDYIL